MNLLKNTKNIEARQNFVENLKVNEKSPEQKKKEFIKRLEENPQLLQELSNDRLEKILQYYLEEIKRKRKILETLS